MKRETCQWNRLVLGCGCFGRMPQSLRLWRYAVIFGITRFRASPVEDCWWNHCLECEDSSCRMTGKSKSTVECQTAITHLSEVARNSVPLPWASTGMVVITDLRIFWILIVSFSSVSSPPFSSLPSNAHFLHWYRDLTCYPSSDSAVREHWLKLEKGLDTVRCLMVAHSLLHEQSSSTWWMTSDWRRR